MKAHIQHNLIKGVKIYLIPFYLGWRAIDCKYQTEEVVPVVSICYPFHFIDNPPERFHLMRKCRN